MELMKIPQIPSVLPDFCSGSQAKVMSYFFRKKEFGIPVKFNHGCIADNSVPVTLLCLHVLRQLYCVSVRDMKPFDQFKKVLDEVFHLGQEFHMV